MITRARHDRSEDGTSSAELHPLAHLANALLAYQHGTRWDPRYLVFEPAAFHGVQSTTQYERALRIVASRQVSTRAQPTESPLPRLTCGAPSATSARGACGFLLSPATAAGKRYYASHTCERRHHATSAPRHIERVVQEMVISAFHADHLAPTVDGVMRRTHAVQLDLRRITKELDRTQAIYDQLSRRESEASANDDPRDFEHYREQRRHYQSVRDGLRDQVLALRTELEGQQSADDVGVLLREATRLAGDVAAFFDAVRDDLAATRQLIGLLTRSIRVRNITRFIALVEIEFAHGARATNIFVTDTVRSSHGERAWARARLQAGATPEEVTAELERYAPAMSGDSPHTTDRTLTLALLSQWFECVDPRGGPLESLASLGSRTRARDDDLRAALVRGLLGPVAVGSGGSLLVAPTEDELRRAVPSYQARRMAAKMRWPITDTVALVTLQQELEVPSEIGLARQLRRGTPQTRDEFGRVYTRRSAVTTQLHAIAAAHRARHAARLLEIKHASLRARQLPLWLADDLYLAGPLWKRLMQRVGYPSRSLFDIASSRGDILVLPMIREPRPDDYLGRASVLIYCPKAVVNATSRSVVRHWLHGGFPLPTSTSSRRSLARATSARRKGRFNAPPSDRSASHPPTAPTTELSDRED